MTAPLVILAAGGTGGHMFPAQALAEHMLAQGWRVKLSTDARGARYTDGFPDAVQIETVASSTFARGGIANKLKVPFQILRGWRAARKAMRADPPAAVVGFGGYPAIPAMMAATSLKIPSMIHEQNGVLGRVNQLFAKRVDKVACGTWPTELPDGVDGVPVGNPVRAAILAKHEADYIPPGDYPMSILVMGGSQGATILSQVVPAALAQVPDTVRQHLRVAHQARAEDLDQVVEDYAAAGIPAVVETFFDDVPQRMSECQLVITRSGASTVADVSIIGRPSVLVPLAAAIRDEQTANAQALVEAEAAILLPEPDFTPDALAAEVTGLLTHPDIAAKMAQAALHCARPNATADLAELVALIAKD